MKNIEKKIQKNFTTNEIKKGYTESFLSLKQSIIGIMFPIILLNYNVYINNLLPEPGLLHMIFVLIIILLILVPILFIPLSFLAIYADTYSLRKKNKINIFKFMNQRDKNIKKFKKNFNSVSNILYIHNKLKNANEDCSDENYYNFYKNFDKNVFTKIKEETEEKIKEETNKINNEQNKKIIEATKKTLINEKK